MSKGIFIMKDQTTIDILNEYIDLCLYEYGKKGLFSGIIDCCFCINFNSSLSSHNIYDKEDRDEFIEWIRESSLAYLRSSGIDTVPLTSFFIECISCDDPVLLKNSKDATVIFHINGKQGYITTHKGKVNYLIDDKKYLIVAFKS